MVPASITWRISSCGTGSGLNRRLARQELGVAAELLRVHHLGGSQAALRERLRQIARLAIANRVGNHLIDEITQCASTGRGSQARIVGQTESAGERAPFAVAL